MSANHSTCSESWRPVVGYEAIYEVSDLGGVRSIARRVRVGHGATRSVKSRMVTQTRHKMGYLVVSLQRGNKGRGFLVHRLVATAFIGAIPPHYEVNHKDGDKHNNAVVNLEIVTRQQNIDHAVESKLIDNKGNKNSQAKLTAEKVKEIRAAYTFGGYRCGGTGYKAVAKRFGLSWGTIRSIVKRYTWKHID